MEIAKQSHASGKAHSQFKAVVERQEARDVVQEEPAQVIVRQSPERRVAPVVQPRLHVRAVFPARLEELAAVLRLVLDRTAGLQVRCSVYATAASTAPCSNLTGFLYSSPCSAFGVPQLRVIRMRAPGVADRMVISCSVG